MCDGSIQGRTDGGRRHTGENRVFRQYPETRGRIQESREQGGSPAGFCGVIWRVGKKVPGGSSKSRHLLSARQYPDAYRGAAADPVRQGILSGQQQAGEGVVSPCFLPAV